MPLFALELFANLRIETFGLAHHRYRHWSRLHWLSGVTCSRSNCHEKQEVPLGRLSPTISRPIEPTHARVNLRVVHFPRHRTETRNRQFVTGCVSIDDIAEATLQEIRADLNTPLGH